MKKIIKLSLLYSQFIFILLLPIWIELTQYLHPLVIVIVWFCFSSFGLFVVCWVKNETILIPKRTLHVIMFLYSSGLLILLFFRPQDQSYESISLIPFETIRLYLSGHVGYLIAVYNLGANIGLFLPFGVYYRYLKKKPTFLEIILITICSISTIESLQYITKRGSLDIDDLILNVIGVSLGYFIYPFFQKVMVINK